MKDSAHSMPVILMNLNILIISLTSSSPVPSPSMMPKSFSQFASESGSASSPSDWPFSFR